MASYGVAHYIETGIHPRADPSRTVPRKRRPDGSRGSLINNTYEIDCGGVRIALDGRFDAQYGGAFFDIKSYSFEP
jgi:hypothetical protein